MQLTATISSLNLVHHKKTLNLFSKRIWIKNRSTTTFKIMNALKCRTLGVMHKFMPQTSLGGMTNDTQGIRMYNTIHTQHTVLKSDRQTDAHAHTQTHTQTDTHRHTHTHACMHARTHTRTHAHTHTHTHRPNYRNPPAHACRGFTRYQNAIASLEA